MKILNFNSQEEASRFVASIINEEIIGKPDANLGLVTGVTPMKMYSCILDDFKSKHTDWSKISTFNLDEYHNVDYGNDVSYHKYMNDVLFNYVNIKKENIHFPELDKDYDSLID
ncbi:MAG: 6-phosphogluconolactonase, partial [Mycoplasma sp.]